MIQPRLREYATRRYIFPSINKLNRKRNGNYYRQKDKTFNELSF